MSAREEFLKASLSKVQDRIKSAAESAGRNPHEITLIAVTKTYPIEDVKILKSLGVENFGENRDEEGSEKSKVVEGIWHFQGQIQSKKLRSIASWASVIHSLDSQDHVAKLSNVLADREKVMQVFIQLSLDGDPKRGGVVADDLEKIATPIIADSQMRLVGLMSVPPVEMEVERAFESIATIHQKFIATHPEAIYLSAGMSSDFEVAIKHGATHIRVGSQILGSRTYPQ
jgi:pyridoxal phosphate enzyme (YggS family)